MLDAEVCARALGARDARFDGLFFVGITSTRVYCRPVCPARVSYPDRRRFFETPAAAEGAGYRPCLRCRPELAPGRAIVDAIPRLAHVAAHRIAAGALNERSVCEFARDLGVSERHLRRAMEREVGVSPVELAQTHRLLLAKQLLSDTTLPITRVAFASGFQSLRRFNAVFLERYRMSPSALRNGRRLATGRVGRHAPRVADAESAPLCLTLAYREPFAWDALLAVLHRDALPGVEAVDGESYRRTVKLGDRVGTVLVRRGAHSARQRRHAPNLNVEVSPTLLPVLMPLLARLRHLFDLDAEPTVIDAHLEQGGLGALVREQPGLRLAGAFDGFEIALSMLTQNNGVLQRIVESLGDEVEGVDDACLTHTAPTAQRVAAAGAPALEALGVTSAAAHAIEAVAHMTVTGALRLEPGSDADATHRTLASIDGVGNRVATAILTRALQWPDAFPSSDPVLQQAAGVSSAEELIARADTWRPWRAYAASHLSAQGAAS